MFWHGAQSGGRLRWRCRGGPVCCPGRPGPPVGVSRHPSPRSAWACTPRDPGSGQCYSQGSWGCHPVSASARAQGQGSTETCPSFGVARCSGNSSRCQSQPRSSAVGFPVSPSAYQRKLPGAAVYRSRYSYKLQLYLSPLWASAHTRREQSIGRRPSARERQSAASARGLWVPRGTNPGPGLSSKALWAP